MFIFIFIFMKKGLKSSNKYKGLIDHVYFNL